MLKDRVLTAVIGAPLMLAMLWFGDWWLVAGIGVLAILAIVECKVLLLNRQVTISLFLAALLVGVILSLFCVVHQIFIVKWLLFSFPIIGLLLMPSNLNRLFKNVFYTFLVSIYVGVGFFSFVMLRDIHINENISGSFWFVLVIILATWSSDIGAFFVGKRYGKHSLAPTISPNKTVEGSLGGFLMVLLVVFSGSFLMKYPFEMALSLGLVIGMAAPLGDLFESKLKRLSAIKDSGNILPGHGGILDRFDSLLFVSPAVLAWSLIMMELK